MNISPDGQAITVLFDGSIVAELVTDGKDSVTTVAVVRVPVTLPEPITETFLGYYVNFKGFIDKTEGTHVSIFVNVGNATKTIQYKVGTPLHEDFDENIFSFGNKHPLPPSAHLTAMIVITMQRSGKQDNGLVKIDSLDVEINKLQTIPKDEE